MLLSHSLCRWPIFHYHKQEKFFIIFILNMHLCSNLNILFFLNQSIMNMGKRLLPFCTCLLQYLKSVITAVSRQKSYQNIQYLFFLISMHKIRTGLVKYIEFSIAILLLTKSLKISETIEKSSHPNEST